MSGILYTGDRESDETTPERRFDGSRRRWRERDLIEAALGVMEASRGERMSLGLASAIECLDAAIRKAR